MSLNGMLKVFKIIWIIWIYLFSCVGQLEAKIGYFWHISDLHFDNLYSMKGDVSKSCWHLETRQTNSPVSSPPGRFGDYNCDSPWSLLESAAQAMKSRQGDNVEFVLWTGDGLAHSRRHNEGHRLELLRNITDLLGRTFSSQFVFPVLGHEDINSFRKLSELWRHWLPSEAVQTFERGGYYTIEQTKSKLRIIALNTNFMRHDNNNKYSQSHSAAVRQRLGNNGAGDSSEYTHYHRQNHYRGSNNNQQQNNNNNNNGGYGYNLNHGNNNGGGGGSGSSGNNGGTVSALSGGESHESEKQWDWLEEVLDKSSRNKETVYIVGHIPPGSDERQVGITTNGHTTFSEKNNLRYLRLVRKYSTIILGQFFGHLHSDSFRIIYNEHGKPVSWIMVAPSVTPRKSGIGSNNPAMRLYKFDTDTGQVLDYTQYYLDLAGANAANEAIWQPEYNLTTQYFGLGDVTAVALHNLADRFSNTENPLFSKYYRANSVRYQTGPCENACALNHYCAITRVDYREYRQCLETAASALASSSSKSSGSTISHITLILSMFSILFTKYHQRKLMLNWLNFTFDIHRIVIKFTINNLQQFIFFILNFIIYLKFRNTNINNNNFNKQKANYTITNIIIPITYETTITTINTITSITTIKTITTTNETTITTLNDIKNIYYYKMFRCLSILLIFLLLIFLLIQLEMITSILLVTSVVVTIIFLMVILFVMVVLMVKLLMTITSTITTSIDTAVAATTTTTTTATISTITDDDHDGDDGDDDADGSAIVAITTTTAILLSIQFMVSCINIISMVLIKTTNYFKLIFNFGLSLSLNGNDEMWPYSSNCCCCYYYDSSWWSSCFIITNFNITNGCCNSNNYNNTSNNNTSNNNNNNNCSSNSTIKYNNNIYNTDNKIICYSSNRRKNYRLLLEKILNFYSNKEILQFKTDIIKNKCQNNNLLLIKIIIINLIVVRYINSSHKIQLINNYNIINNSSQQLLFLSSLKLIHPKYIQ